MKIKVQVTENRSVFRLRSDHIVGTNKVMISHTEHFNLIVPRTAKIPYSIRGLAVLSAIGSKVDNNPLVSKFLCQQNLDI